MDKDLILTDTEPETSMEQFVEQKIQKRVSTNATNTLFNITFENSLNEKYESLEFQDYEGRLRQNMKDWKSLYLNAYKDLKHSKEKHPVVDKSVLRPEKLQYLEQAINLQSFIRESLEFRQKATLFLDFDYAEYMEMQGSLEDLYEHKLNLIKANKIAENLANFEM